MTIHKVFRPFHLTILGNLLFHSLPPSYSTRTCSECTGKHCTHVHHTDVYERHVFMLLGLIYCSTYTGVASTYRGAMICQQRREEKQVQKKRMQASKAAWVGKGVENIDRSSDLYGSERRHINLFCMFPTKCLELPLLLIPHSIRDILPFLQFHQP